MVINLNQHVALEADHEKASSRTKGRIQEHGVSGFIVRDHQKASSAFAGRPATLLESLKEGGRRGERWLGWLPLDEIKVKAWGV